VVLSIDIVYYCTSSWFDTDVLAVDSKYTVDRNELHIFFQVANSIYISMSYCPLAAITLFEQWQEYCKEGMILCVHFICYVCMYVCMHVGMYIEIFVYVYVLVNQYVCILVPCIPCRHHNLQCSTAIYYP
jgi:hypothetical protein